MAGSTTPATPPAALAVAVTMAAVAGSIAVAITAGTTEAVALTVTEALLTAACAWAWSARRPGASLVAIGSLVWAATAYVAIVHTDSANPESLTGLPGWGIALAVILLVAGGVGLPSASRRTDLIGMLVDTGAVLIALVWLLGNLQPGSNDGWSNATGLVFTTALAASVALVLVAHATDHSRRLVNTGGFVVAFTGAALVAVRPEELASWWVIPVALGFVIITCGVLAGGIRAHERRDQPGLWAQLLPIVPAGAAVCVAFASEQRLTTWAGWTLVVVVIAALARQTVVLSRGHLRLRYLEQTLGSFRHDAEHDPLTGLANRALFNQRIDRVLDHSRRSSLAVLFLDLDDFKNINDSLGHAAGDELLVAVAARLHSTVRAQDTVARLGGDEFGILLDGLDRVEEAEQFAERVLSALQPSFSVGDAEMHVGVSVGVAPVDQKSTTSQLLRQADLALYAAKEHGKNQWRSFSWTMQRDARDRFEMKAQLREAIEGEELLIYFQPIVAVSNNQVAGFEALVRWNHSTRGLLLPERFIPLAEEFGVIHELGLVVLRAACRQLAAWDAEFPGAPPWYIAVNVAVQQFDHADLLADITDVLKETGVEPERVVLEVTESSVMEDPERVLDLLQQLRELGIRVAIDDFGTGYSAMHYLRRFPVDILKIDKSFVTDLQSGATGATLMRAMVELGHSLGHRTVVEGVESHLQLQAVRELGCDFVQGYLFATPGPGSEITRLLRNTTDRGWALVRGGAPIEVAPLGASPTAR